MISKQQESAGLEKLAAQQLTVTFAAPAQGQEQKNPLAEAKLPEAPRQELSLKEQPAVTPFKETYVRPAEAPKTLAEFYPYYLSMHRDPRNRAVHYVGTAIAVGFGGAALVTGLATGNLLLAFGAPAVGQAIAYGILIPFGHKLFEKNDAAGLSGKGWSKVGSILRAAVSDLRMCFRAATGQLHKDFARFGISSDPRRTEG